MPARAVSSPTAVTCDPQPGVGRDGARDHRSPCRGETGRDSPVTIDSSISPSRRRCVRPRAPAARPDDDDVADSQLRGATVDVLAVLDALRLVGQQGGKRVQGRSGLGERAHLEPVPEQHDHDQQRQLPPEVELVVEHTKRRTPRGDERDRDRQADEQHHPGASTNAAR